MSGLAPLFAPSSIALVGASADPAKFGGRPLAALRRHGFAGPVHVVNHHGGSFDGATCVRSVEELPEGIDLAVLLVPAGAVDDALGACVGRGVRAAAVFTGGFRELGPEGAARQERLRRLCAESGVRLLGPNSPGFVNVHGSVACSASAFGTQPAIPGGSVAFVSQSGGIAGVLADRAIAQGIGLSAVVSTGNEADVDAADVVGWLVEEGHTRAVGLFLEGFGQGHRFADALAEARRAGVRLAVLRAGGSPQARHVIASHTGALVASQAGFDAVCRSLGILQASDYQELLEMTHVLGTVGEGSRRAVVVGFSGGMNAVLADAAAAHGVALEALQPSTVEAMAAITPDFGSAANPADISSAILTEPERLGRAIEIVAGDPAAGAVVVAVGDHPPALSERLARIVAGARGAAGVPVVLQWSAGALSGPGMALAAASGVPVLSEPGRCMAVLAAAADAAGTPRPPRHPEGHPADLGRSGGWSEHEVKDLLESAGLRAPRRVLLADPGDAPKAVAELGGRAVVKASCTGAVHKSELGAVLVGVTADEAERAARSVLAAASEHLGPGRVRGVLVEELVRPVAELFVAGTVDEHAGPLISVGSGGLLVELVADTVTRLAPVGVDEALQMLQGVHAARLLDGFRGGPGGDMAALAAAVSRVSELTDAWAGQLQVLELNPVAACDEGAVVLDAVLTVRGEGAP